nr:ATP-dependent metallopeptidase FtsH/Yme1/Tma family protein [Nostocaceae cyanobacterium]
MAIKEQRQPPRFAMVANILLALSSVFLLLNLFVPGLFGNQTSSVPYSLFIHQVESGDVSRVSVGQDQIRYQIKTEDNSQPGAIFVTTPIFDLELPKLLEAKGIEFAAAPAPKNGWFTSLLGWVVPPLIFVAVLQFFANRNGGGPQGALSIGKSKAKVYVEGESDKITFADVAGVEEAKAELVEIVDFLKTPARFIEIGARIPKGVLLVGPPG